MQSKQWIGPATFVLVLAIALLGRRQESFDEAGRNLVSRHETRAERAEAEQASCAAGLAGLAPIERFLEESGAATARLPASNGESVILQ